MSFILCRVFRCNKIHPIITALNISKKVNTTIENLSQESRYVKGSQSACLTKARKKHCMVVTTLVQHFQTTTDKDNVSSPRNGDKEPK